MPEISVIRSEALSDFHNSRYIIVDKESGEVLDDAQGYGYKSAQKAHAAWGWKSRDRSEDRKKEQRRRKIRTWMKKHPDFVEAMDTFAFEIAKGSWGPDEKFDAKFVREMLKENGLKTDFTPGELLRVWEKS